MESLVLKPGEDRRLKRGHLWVFSNEVAILPGSAGAGDLVEVVSSRRQKLGTAFYSPHSLIIARILGAGVDEVGSGFLGTRLATAAELRSRLFPEDDSYRLVHGESDFLPGLIIDRYGSAFVVQTLTAGMDQRQSLVVEALQQLFEPAVIVERNDTHLRQYEGLEERRGILAGQFNGPVECSSAGIRYSIDLLGGQKTGLFLDQRGNRVASAVYCRGARVLDCFCNAGGFSLHAAHAGASSVIGIDSSPVAIEAARRNAVLNGLDRSAQFIQADVFDFLESRLRTEERFDLVVLDPPSFAPRKKDVAAAKAAYRKLNQLALGLISPGGVLVTASCSFHLFEDVFYWIVEEAATRAGRKLQLLERRFQSPDHPILPAMPETAYLKLGIFRVH